MSEPNAVVWGAGRIGRGFVADLFHAGGYHVTLVDAAEDLIAGLRAAGRYTVAKLVPGEPRRDEVISGYAALGTAQTEATAAAVAAADALAVVVFPQYFAPVARQLVPGLLRRRAERPEAPLDILVCANLRRAAPQFESLLLGALPPPAQAYAAERIGVVGTVVIRAVVEPPPGELAVDPLLVWTDGTDEFPADRRAFKAEVPRIPGLRLTDKIHAEETRKLYTYNMCHAALAYHGALRGYALSMECLADAWVSGEVAAALAEVRLALQAEYDLSPEDMARWFDSVPDRVNNSGLADKVARLAADPRRKLKRDDRLVGPALMARHHGIRPAHLARAIAAALWFENPGDPGAVYVRERIAQAGLPAATREICELTPGEDDFLAMIESEYHSLSPA